MYCLLITVTIDLSFYIGGTSVRCVNHNCNSVLWTFVRLPFYTIYPLILDIIVIIKNSITVGDQC